MPLARQDCSTNRVAISMWLKLSVHPSIPVNVRPQNRHAGGASYMCRHIHRTMPAGLAERRSFFENGIEYCTLTILATRRYKFERPRGVL
jgi:hypothetical protein